MTRLCIHCIHLTKLRLCLKGPRSSVDGEPHPVLACAIWMREQGACGSDGKMFEPIAKSLGRTGMNCRVQARPFSPGDRAYCALGVVEIVGVTAQNGRVISYCVKTQNGAKFSIHAATTRMIPYIGPVPGDRPADTEGPEAA